MARPKLKINAKRCERLKQIIEETGIHQNQLCADTGISQQAISAMVNKKANVTDQTAELIIERFPQYSLAWLKGDTDYKNNADKFNTIISQVQHEGDLY